MEFILTSQLFLFQHLDYGILFNVEKFSTKIGECFYVFEIWEANDRFSFEFGWNHNLISTIDCINGFN